jgi:hypothetical protein
MALRSVAFDGVVVQAVFVHDDEIELRLSIALSAARSSCLSIPPLLAVPRSPQRAEPSVVS